MSIADTDTRTTPRRLARTAGRRALTIVGAAVVNLALWALVDLAVGIPVTVEMGGAVQPVGPGGIALSSGLAGAAGWALLAVLERSRPRPRRTWTIVALVVLVVSLAGPIGAAVDTASMVTLIGMHLVTAAVLVPGLLAPNRPSVRDTR